MNPRIIPRTALVVELEPENERRLLGLTSLKKYTMTSKKK